VVLGADSRVSRDDQVRAQLDAGFASAGSAGMADVQPA